jgi:hypothetical protein
MARIIAEPARLADGLARAGVIRDGTDPVTVAAAYLDLYAAARAAPQSATVLASSGRPQLSEFRP